MYPYKIENKELIISQFQNNELQYTFCAKVKTKVLVHEGPVL